MVTALNPGSARVGSQVGRSVPRLEGRDKVTGRAEYTHTMRLPGMLHAKIFRSTVAHGLIRSIDTSAAKKVPGVLHVGDQDSGPSVELPDGEKWAFERVQRSGDPVEEILGTAREIGANLIVMPTAGRNGFLDAVRGTTTERVLRQAPCPVLAVPAQD